jgi:hypothetical protein
MITSLFIKPHCFAAVRATFMAAAELKRESPGRAEAFG